MPDTIFHADKEVHPLYFAWKNLASLDMFFPGTSGICRDFHEKAGIRIQ
jgi:hypothetical protein